jgi:predicted ATPase/class 3 adenylate cyclase
MAALPTGTVTFLFTDIEGSTQLLDTLGDRYAGALAAHGQLLRQAFGAHGGHVVDAQGDAFLAVFPSARGAIEAAAGAQRALTVHDWPDGLQVLVRMGLHTGEPAVDGAGYVGMDVNRGARIASAGHGGQVLLSQTTRDLLGEEIGDDLAVRDLGDHRLKDLGAPQRLYQLVIHGLESEFPPPKTLENRPTNLPTQPTPLIGRKDELERAGSLLGRDDVRLLTFTGPGGTGKTRLACQVAAEVLEDFRDGVFFVNLAAIADAGLIVPTIAQTLAVRERAGQSLEDTLVEYLRGRRLLLLLDNFEQVLAGAPSVARLLSAAPELKVVATSRAPLRLASEHEYDVPPLDLPAGEYLPEPSVLSQYEAVALFVARARSVRADFAVTNENAPAIAEICVRLDGLPLAIELAAARVRALPPRALLSRLDRRFKLLTMGAVDAPARQQTLRAAIDWSYALLEEEEQRLLARLSVFAGGWDLEAAEAVCGREGPPDVVDGISSLVENSLVRVESGRHGEPRFSMLESIREYAQEMLGAGGEAQTLRRLHAEHFLALSERADRTIMGDEVPLADAPEEQVQHELPNLRAAFEWAFEEGGPEFVLRLAAAASTAWGAGGWFGEARTLLTRALDAAPHLQTLARARTLHALASLEIELGGYRRAEAVNAQALELVRRLGDGLWLVRVLALTAEGRAHRGQVESARLALDEARTVADDLRSDHARCEVCLHGAIVETLADGNERAQALLEEGVELLRGLGVPRRIWSFQLINLGWVALQQEDFPRAKAALSEYLAEESSKSPVAIAIAQSNLGLVAVYEGEPEEAASRFRQSLPLARKSGVKPVIAEGLHGMAAVAAMEGDGERSLRLWAAADAVSQAMGAPLTAPEQFIVERYLEPVRAELPDAVRRKASDEGAAMTLDEAVAYALEDHAIQGPVSDEPAARQR